MPPRITLTITKGPLQGEVFTFDERTTCLVGRGSDCQPKLPTDEEHRVISRHHCMLDINAPDIRIRDFGSLNGTWVNGKKIGQREKGLTAKQATTVSFPEYDLKDGDEIKLGHTLIRVGVYIPAVCGECSQEIPDERREQSDVSPQVYQCDACRTKAKAALQKALSKALSKPSGRHCAACGKDVSKEIGENRTGDYICAACQADPLQIVMQLLRNAKTGQANLMAIDGYSILKELGRGGCGAVYLARHDRTQQQVALKVMLPKVAADERAVARFLRETENTKALRHSRIVSLRDAGCSEGTFFMTLEFCDSGSVYDLMKARGGKLSIAESAPIILQTLEALEYAHQAKIPNVRLKDGSYRAGRGLVHRDLKPHNILLCKSGRAVAVKMGDFGLAKAFDTAGLSGQTSGDAAAGTPVFVAREQVRSFLYAKPDVDVWAAAATFYTMLTGTYVRDFSRDKQVWLTVLECDAVPIRKRDPSIPKQLAEVIDAALVETPRIGFQTATEFKRALEAVL